jgi:hypothetical protein
MGLCVWVYVSLISRLSFHRLYTWKYSSVFNTGPFFSIARLHPVQYKILRKTNGPIMADPLLG